MMKILIALTTFNRPYITDICLKNMARFRSDTVKLVIYDDASTAYDQAYLEQFADEVIRFPFSGGQPRSRSKTLRDFLYRYTDYDLLYLTDNDTVHDPQFLDILRNGFANGETTPLGLFNTHWFNTNDFSFWEGHKNVISQDDTYFYTKLMAGVSQCYTRKMIEDLVYLINTSPDLDYKYGWDMNWIKALDTTTRFTKISYVEHFARDRNEPGMHTPIIDSGDFDITRAVNPTPFLKDIRQQVIEEILGP